MEKVTAIDFEVFAQIVQWMLGIIGALLGILGFFYLVDRKAQNKRIEKLEDYFIASQEQLTKLSEQVNVSIEVIKVNQKHDSERIDILHRLLESQIMEDKIVTKLKALQGS